jgi:hypothetical protein
LLSDEHLPGEQVLRRSFFGINDVVSPNQVVATKASVLSITSANPATTELEPELLQSVNQVQIRNSSAVRIDERLFVGRDGDAARATGSHLHTLLHLVTQS